MFEVSYHNIVSYSKMTTMEKTHWTYLQQEHLLQLSRMFFSPFVHLVDVAVRIAGIHVCLSVRESYQVVILSFEHLQAFGVGRYGNIPCMWLLYCGPVHTHTHYKEETERSILQSKRKRRLDPATTYHTCNCQSTLVSELVACDGIVTCFWSAWTRNNRRACGRVWASRQERVSVCIFTIPSTI
jgi:hypothetical protein